MKPFHSLFQMIDTLHTEEDCRLYLEDMRWHGEPVCPHCGSIHIIVNIVANYFLGQKNGGKFSPPAAFPFLPIFSSFDFYK